ncbi:MAG: nuclear transport factor 2 family protein [Gammaproteobacteria bacterium]|nr:nuclear transport factor 2 family protein [Gammaproteobacteria bacterium]
MKNGFSTADAAEQAFYRALHEKDIHAMSEVWMDSDAIACIHPMGARLQGRQEVMASWQQIFSGENTLAFELKDVHRQQSAKLAVHLLHEYIVPDKQQDKVTIAETTNVYVYQEGAGWLMLLHHASLSPKTVIERQGDEGQQQNVLH